MSYLKVEFKVVPVKDIKHLNISFPIPDVSQHYESKVRKYSVTFKKFYLIKGILLLMQNNNIIDK